MFISAFDIVLWTINEDLELEILLILTLWSDVSLSKLSSTFAFAFFSEKYTDYFSSVTL